MRIGNFYNRPCGDKAKVISIDNGYVTLQIDGQAPFVEHHDIVWATALQCELQTK